MFYDGLHFWGMHLIWWLVWLSVILWIFAVPYGIPGQRKKHQSPFHILRNRFAAGDLTLTQYREMKQILENDQVIKKG